MLPCSKAVNQKHILIKLQNDAICFCFRVNFKKKTDIGYRLDATYAHRCVTDNHTNTTLKVVNL